MGCSNHEVGGPWGGRLCDNLTMESPDPGVADHGVVGPWGGQTMGLSDHVVARVTRDDNRCLLIVSNNK